jgi:hypothetical protein
MVETRSGEQTNAQNFSASKRETACNTKQRYNKLEETEIEDGATADEKMNEVNETAEKRKRNEAEEEPEIDASENEAVEQPPTKAARADPKVEDEERKGAEDRQGNGEKSAHEVNEAFSSKIHKAIIDYGSAPLGRTAVKEPLKATPETLLAIVLDAMLSSTRISHGLAQQALNAAIDAGYHDITKLSKSTWDERVNVMAKGGYNRYREQTATRLGHLANLIVSKYGK